MADLKVGDKVIWHNWAASRSWARSSRKVEAKVFKVAKKRIGIEMADGMRRFVEPENLTKQAPLARKEAV